MFHSDVRIASMNVGARVSNGASHWDEASKRQEDHRRMATVEGCEKQIQKVR